MYIGAYPAGFRLEVEILEDGTIKDPFGWPIGKCDDEWFNTVIKHENHVGSNAVEQLDTLETELAQVTIERDMLREAWSRWTIKADPQEYLAHPEHYVSYGNMQRIVKDTNIELGKLQEENQKLRDLLNDDQTVEFEAATKSNPYEEVLKDFMREMTNRDMDYIGEVEHDVIGRYSDKLKDLIGGEE